MAGISIVTTQCGATRNNAWGKALAGKAMVDLKTTWQ
jgi:hypothetical protein